MTNRELAVERAQEAVAAAALLLVRTLPERARREIIDVLRNSYLVKKTEKTVMWGTFTCVINKATDKNINKIFTHKVIC